MANNNSLFNESKSVDLGISYLHQKNYELATKEFNKVLKANPKNETAIIKLGHVYLQQKKFTEAISEFNKVLKLNPQSIDPHEGLGFCYFEQGYIEEAIEKFNYVLKFTPNNEHPHFGLGLCYYQKKEFDKVIREFNQVLKINPRHKQVCCHLGMCYLQQKDFPRALTQFKRALELNPQNWHAHEGLACVYLEEDKLDLCLEELKRIEDSKSESEPYHHIIARVYIKQKKYDLAIGKLQRILKIDPRSEFAYESLIRIYLKQQKYDLAIEYADRLSSINPSNINLYQELGNIYLEKKDYPQALTQFKRALELNPQNWHAHEGLACVYLEEDKLDLCLEELKRIEDSKSESEPYHHIIARVYIKQKKYDLAIGELQKTLKINPRSEFAYESLMRIYLKQQKYDLAIEYADRLSSINPSNINLYQELGNIYLEKKDYPQALTQFKRALEFYSKRGHTYKGLNASGHDLMEVYINIGSTYLLMKKYRLAIENLKKAAEIDPEEKRINELISKAYIGIGNYDLAVDITSKNYNPVDIGAETSFIKADIASKQGSNGIKILRIPNFYGPEVLSAEMNSIMLPPLALGNIVSYIRSQDIRIDQDDLHIKIHYDNYFSEDPEEKIDETVFFDDCRILKYTNGNDDSEIDKIMERVSNKTSLQGYKIILFSLDSCSMNFSHVIFSLCLAKYLKKKYNPIIILGGLTYFPELMQKIGCTWSDIDYVVCKEGEEVLAKLLLSLLDNSSSGMETKIEIKQRVLYADKVPKPVKPDFDGLPLERYRYRGLKTDYCQDEKLRDLIREFNVSQTFLLPIRFIKGCTNRCIFCASSIGGLIHVVAPTTVVAWLQELQTEYNPTGYLFLNDTLNISKKYLNQLCNEIIKRKLNILWSDCVRVDRLDKDSIYKMRDAGCIRMVFGMETASKKLLEYINKDIDLKELEDRLYWANKAGIWTGIEIISGLPYEEEKDTEETIAFLKQNREYIDALYYNAFNIKDTSLLRTYPERYGITNIFEISSYEDGFSTFVKYGFDEIKGLPWSEKRKQILTAFNKTIQHFGDVPFPEHEYEHFLFFLYSKYKDKKIVKKLFYAVGEEKMRHLNLLRKMKKSEMSVPVSTTKILAYGGK